MIQNQLQKQTAATLHNKTAWTPVTKYRYTQHNYSIYKEYKIYENISL